MGNSLSKIAPIFDPLDFSGVRQDSKDAQERKDRLAREAADRKDSSVTTTVNTGMQSVDDDLLKRNALAAKNSAATKTNTASQLGVL
jgi:hypothetical protein